MEIREKEPIAYASSNVISKPLFFFFFSFSWRNKSFGKRTAEKRKTDKSGVRFFGNMLKNINGFKQKKQPNRVAFICSESLILNKVQRLGKIGNGAG